MFLDEKMGKNQLSAPISEELDEAVEEFEDSEGFATRAEAIRHLVRCGLDSESGDGTVIETAPQPSLLQLASGTGARVALVGAVIAGLLSLGMRASLAAEAISLGVASLVLSTVYLAELNVESVSNWLERRHHRLLAGADSQEVE